MRLTITLFIFYAFFISQKNYTQDLKIDKPNFIIYIADDHNYQDYEINGNNDVQTSAVKKLAAEGITFKNAYTSQAICAPSRSQLYTGLYPMKNGVMANHLPTKNVADINDFLAEIGYEVVLAGKGHVKPKSVYNWTKFIPIKSEQNFISDDNQKNDFIERIDNYFKNNNKPFCLIVASHLPHGPYADVDNYNKNKSNKNFKYTKRFSKAGYYQNIDDDNSQINKVLDLVKKNNLKNSTVFIYISDHGLDGKWTVYESGLKIPLVIRWPGKIKSGTFSNEMISIVDILPTLIDLGGGNSEKLDLDGYSFANSIDGQNSFKRTKIFGIATRQNIFKSYVFPSRSIRENNFKYIKNYNSREVVNNNLGPNENVNKFILRGAMAFPEIPYEELYDLSVDPDEKNNLADNKKYFSLKNDLEKKLNNWMINQNDFLINHKMPLIKPSREAVTLDYKTSRNNIPDELVGILKESDYLKFHY